jgi:hypothetical protein
MHARSVGAHRAGASAHTPLPFESRYCRSGAGGLWRADDHRHAARKTESLRYEHRCPRRARSPRYLRACRGSHAIGGMRTAMRRRNAEVLRPGVPRCRATTTCCRQRCGVPHIFRYSHRCPLPLGRPSLIAGKRKAAARIETNNGWLRRRAPRDRVLPLHRQDRQWLLQPDPHVRSVSDRKTDPTGLARSSHVRYQNRRPETLPARRSGIGHLAGLAVPRREGKCRLVGS